MSLKNKPNAKRNIYITRQQSIALGLSFYIGEKACKTCGYNKPVRYTVNCNCVNCESKRYKKKDQSMNIKPNRISIPAEFLEAYLKGYPKDKAKLVEELLEKSDEIAKMGNK